MQEIVNLAIIFCLGVDLWTICSTCFPFFRTLRYNHRVVLYTASVPNQNKDIEFWLSAHIVRAYPYMELTNTKDEQMTSRCMQRFVTFKILYN